MAPHDPLIYGAHVLFWLIFAAGNFHARRLSRTPAASPTVPGGEGQAPLRAPYSRLLIALHMVGFAAMYAAIGSAVFHTGAPSWFPGQRLAGGAVILAGAALMYWARVSFASWRFRAQIDAGHQLATGGPYRFLRHPLYAGLDLLALGTAVWMPTAFAWLGAGLMAVGGDLRARAEERLLEVAFGDTYRDYCRRTRRFVPGLY